MDEDLIIQCTCGRLIHLSNSEYPYWEYSGGCPGCDTLWKAENKTAEDDDEKRREEEHQLSPER
ncbi:hypothetical protein LCGC14_3076560 [marine sediment metagenome]|uniref:Uncharacterized protein n=1 Tax=marine sediment metagenome TaxID=412755 RepID=A0A0F8X308_9ZZZZ